MPRHPSPRTSALLTLADAHVDDDRRAFEAVQLAQAALDDPAVALVEEAGREQHEGRRARRRLRAEQDAGLLAAPDGVRVLGDELRQEGVELAGRDALIPR